MQLRPAAVESYRPSTEKARILAEHRRREQRPSPHRIHAEDQECSFICCSRGQETGSTETFSKAETRPRAVRNAAPARRHGNRLKQTDLEHGCKPCSECAGKLSSSSSVQRRGRCVSRRSAGMPSTEERNRVGPKWPNPTRYPDLMGERCAGPLQIKRVLSHCALQACTRAQIVRERGDPHITN